MQDNNINLIIKKMINKHLELIQLEIKNSLIDLRVDPRFLISLCRKTKTFTLYSYNFEEEDISSINIALKDIGMKYNCNIKLSPDLSTLRFLNEFDSVIEKYINFFDLEVKNILKNNKLSEALNKPLKRINDFQESILRHQGNF
jgi:hypothetical protein